MVLSTDRGTCWSVTINNPIKADEENIALARQAGWKVEGQLERGENGTPHYQLMVLTGQVRFSAVKKRFPRAHIELARNPEALSKYVKKDQTREAELTEANEFYPSYSKVSTFFAEECQLYIDKYDSLPNEKLLEIFDQMVDKKIREGYYLENIAVNPQIRSAIKKFGKAIFRRWSNRQTDRQTPETIRGVNSITKDARREDFEEQASYVEQDTQGQGHEDSCSEADEGCSEGEYFNFS